MEAGQIIQFVVVAVLLVGICFLVVSIVKSISAPKKVDGIRKLIRQKKYAQAIKLAKAIIAKNQKDYTARYYLGIAYQLENRSELALMEFKVINEEAVFGEGIPELDFRKRVSQLYMKFNQQSEALKEFLLLTKLDPTNADHFYNVGKIYEQKSRIDVAMGFLQKAISLDRRHVDAHAAMGMCYFRAKQLGDAKKEIDMAIKLSPETFSNYYYLGKILKESKDYPAAVSAFEKAVRDTEFRQRALIERGSCYMAANSLDNAILEFEKAVKYAKDEGSQETLYARYFLASCYEKARKIDNAIEQWEAIFARNRSFRDVASKLEEYKDLQANDGLKEYLTAAPDEFAQICAKAALKGFSMSVKAVQQNKWGCTMTATEPGMNQLSLLQFYRETAPVEDGEVRKVADTVKSKHYAKAVLFASAGFTHSAIGFAENRPIELVGKEKLEQILASAL